MKSFTEVVEVMMPEKFARGWFKHPNNAWDDPKKVEKLKRLLKEEPRLTCREIAIRLGFGSTGKNAIIGKMHRLGLTRGKPRGKPRKSLPPHEPYERPKLK